MDRKMPFAELRRQLGQSQLAVVDVAGSQRDHLRGFGSCEDGTGTYMATLAALCSRCNGRRAGGDQVVYRGSLHDPTERDVSGPAARQPVLGVQAAVPQSDRRAAG